jgi:hypothetical protein
MPAPDSKLIPPDESRCQAECLEGSFMTLGPRRKVRCPQKPVCIATEVAPNSVDGLRGSMSLCQDCLERMQEAFGKHYATIRKL